MEDDDRFKLIAKRDGKFVIEKVRRSGDDPVSPVPASLKPTPSRSSGAVALPEPEED